jgi:multidrug resistance efflux pump
VGTGILEPQSENIAIGAPMPGLVTRVFVQVGSAVQAGAPLFQLDDRSLRAEVGVRAAAVETARQKLQRLRGLPRTEELLPLEAQVLEAEANLADLKAQLARRESVNDPRAVTEDELERRRNAIRTLEARLAAVRAQKELLAAGAWKEDLAVAQAELQQAESALAAAQAELDRLTVRAPTNGTCLQVRIRAGEYADPARSGDALVVLGDTRVMHVRAEFDELEAGSIRAASAAYAALRGEDRRLPLRLVRFEPLVTPKRQLSGSTRERVDTRVLQVVYAVARAEAPLFVGQQVDVFVDRSPSAGGAQ